MKEIVENILKLEEEAKRQLEAARLEAQEIIAQAERGAQEMPEVIVRETKELIRQKKEELRRQASLEKEAVLAAAKTQVANLRARHEEKALLAAQKIFSQIISIPD